MSVCQCKGCELPAYSLGMCNKHWRRNRLYGSPFVLKIHSGHGLSAAERFERRHKKMPNGCWEWIGGLDADGYGVLSAVSNSVQYKKAHRFSWAFHTQQPIPADMVVCHSCDNRKCVNPAHLWLGTQVDNQNDKGSKGRARVLIGEKAPGAKLTEEQALAILADARPHAQIAHDYGITTMTVSDIKCRRSWGHLEVTHVGRAKRVSSRKGVSERITPDIVREIRDSAESGTELALKHNVSKQLICAIRKKRAWAHVN